MKHCILGLLILTLMATTVAATPISVAYLMVSGGPDSADAGFVGENPVLIVPVPEYRPGTVLTWDPGAIPGFDGAWVDDSQVWFLGGELPEDPEDINPETVLFLSQDGNQDVTFTQKTNLLDALSLLLGSDPGGGELPEPFSLDWTAYVEQIFGDTGIEFGPGGPILFTDGFGPIELSYSVSAPSTEVDIIEHSPPDGLGIRLLIEADQDGAITSMSAHVLPEPGTIALFVAGLAGLGLALRRRRS